jgi:hypothetical protein
LLTYRRPKEETAPENYAHLFNTPSENKPDPRSHHADTVYGSDTVGEDKYADFSSPLVTKLLIAAVGGYAVYRIDRHLFGDREIHPIAEFIGLFKEDPAEAEEYHKKWLDITKRAAEDTLILKADVKRKNDQIYRIKDDSCFYKRSSWNILPGQDVDFSNVKVKRSWQEEDKLFGVPYPDKA